MKRFFTFAGMLASAAVFIFLIFVTIAADIVEDLPVSAVTANHVLLYTGLAISFILFITFGCLFRMAKEKEEFNEFGIRKKAAKRKLSSYRREQVEAMQLAETERIITSSELKKALHRGSSDPEEDLNRMIGMSKVKERVRELKARMDFDLKSGKVGFAGEMHHMVFYGSPGTGKTTVARIIAGIMYEYGYINENITMEIDGNFLKAGNAADTEKKVRIILSKIRGGVLFVDEAYALTQSKDAAGKQAVATLIKEMEDNRGHFVAIFAGYTNEMKQMLDVNPGFRSRIRDYIEFPDYSPSELRDIAIMMAGEKGFTISPDAVENLFERFANEKKESTWGNGRTVRNVIEESIDNHAVNYEKKIISKENRHVICSCDIAAQPQKHI